MRKNTFIKQEGIIPVKLPFKKNDVITYVTKESDKFIRDIILLQEPIKHNGKLIIKCKAILRERKKLGFNVEKEWEDGDYIRKPTYRELNTLFQRLITISEIDQTKIRAKNND